MAYRSDNGIILHETVRVEKDEIDFNADKDFSVIYDYKKVPSNFQWLCEFVCWCLKVTFGEYFLYWLMYRRWYRTSSSVISLFRRHHGNVQHSFDSTGSFWWHSLPGSLCDVLLDWLWKTYIQFIYTQHPPSALYSLHVKNDNSKQIMWPGLIQIVRLCWI